MIAEPREPDRDETEQPPAQASLTRLFVREPGWRIAVKVGSEREYCYMTHPGQDHYHRLLDGEIYCFHADEKLCMPCAVRRGLLATEPRALLSEPIHVQATEPPYDLGPRK